jgi:hypothetical protein
MIKNSLVTHQGNKEIISEELERIIPEEKRPQKIKINNKKEFLVE